jgi:hypothetical protein
MYYRLNEDLNIADRWILGDVINDLDEDDWKYSVGKKIELIPADLRMDIFSKGKSLDFSISGSGVPVVSKKFKNLNFGFDDVQFIPISIDEDIFYIMNILNVIDCIDEENSNFEKYIKNDKVRPDKEGEYKGFFKMELDKNKIYSNKIFRVKNFDIAIIVFESFFESINKFNITGCKFTKV